MHNAYDIHTWLDIANGRFATGLLVFGRFGGLLFAAPMIGGKNVPNPVRLGLAAVLAVIVASLLPAVRADSFPAMGAGLAKEILLGLVIPFTLIVILPTNRRLLSPALAKDSSEAARLLDRGPAFLSLLVPFLSRFLQVAHGSASSCFSLR